MTVMPLNEAMRQLAEVTAHVIAKAEEAGLPEAPEKLVSVQATRFLARAYIALRDQARALHDLVDQTDPNDPIGVALTTVGLAQKPHPTLLTGAPRLVPTPVPVENLTTDQIAERYRRVMGNTIDFTKHETFVVRLWDGMDGCWTDCTAEIPRDEALRYWAERTEGGTHHVSFHEIDYYAIFPSGTRMLWDGSDGQEMQR